MQFNVLLQHDFGEQTEDLDFLVNVDEEDCYEMAGENPVTTDIMKQVAVEYAIVRFFKQNHVFNIGDMITVLEVEEMYT
ncbi:hypothetical protein [Paenibacillus sp. 1781tsa1]|uniref:hypothetical protein n=1 Tax=Paenibacillus sp. 1781tsa1 TaxID=2953810 RepID=UPI0020A083A8|nr:hypothetical protein [Paenibacillus sp. 1781tsa1]MCP1184929.1 hypothetical protein [Paenibacillus sp. 1781tsa1]